MSHSKSDEEPLRHFNQTDFAGGDFHLKNKLNHPMYSMESSVRVVAIDLGLSSSSPGQVE